MPTTTDRGAILHLAGARALSPAVRDGRPALAPKGDLAGRCGWEPFFRALDRHGLAVAWEGDGEPAIVPR
jgi:hypothetical protein